jgi:hypothetical protein
MSKDIVFADNAEYLMRSQYFPHCVTIPPAEVAKVGVKGSWTIIGSSAETTVYSLTFDCSFILSL